MELRRKDIFARGNTPSNVVRRSGPTAGERRFSNMKSSTTDKIKGSVKEAAGTVKEQAGRATGNAQTEDRGTAEKTEGKVQKKVGDVKKVFGK